MVQNKRTGLSLSTYAQWRHRGRIAPSDIIQGGDTRVKQTWTEFRKNTGQTTSVGGSCDETTAKKALTKKVVIFGG